MIEAHAGVDVGDHRSGAARSDGPRRHGVGARRVAGGSGCAGGHHVPLSAGIGRRHEQRVIGQGMRITPLIDVRKLDGGIGAQRLECGRGRTAIQRGTEVHHMHARRELAGPSHADMRALHQCVDVCRRGACIGELRARARAAANRTRHLIGGGNTETHHEPVGVGTDLHRTGVHGIELHGRRRRGSEAESHARKRTERRHPPTRHAAHPV